MNAFDSKAYETLLLQQQRVRSLTLEHYREKSKEVLNDYKFNKQTFNSQRREESKEAACNYKQKIVSFSVQFQPNKEKCKEEGGNNQGSDYSYVAQRKTNTSRSDHDINQERINIDARGRKLHQNRTGYLIDTNAPWFKRAHSWSQSIDRERINIYTRERELHQGRTGSLDTSGSAFQRAHNISQSQDQDIQSTLSTCRNRLDQHEGRRLRRQTERHDVESGFELSMDSQLRRMKNRALSYPLDSGKKYTNEERNQHNSSRVTNVGVTRSESQEEMDRLREKLRENLSAVRYRIHSSRALLARHYVDPNTNCEELKERQIPENGRVEYSSKLCREPFQDPGTGTPERFSKSISTSMTDDSVNDNNKIIRRTNQVKNRSEEIRKKKDPNVPSVTKVTTKSTAFDPFPSTIGKSRSRNDATWPVSELSSDFLDAKKSPNVSADGICIGDTANTSSGEAETIPSIEKAETNNDSRAASLNSKESSKLNLLKILSERRTSLICANNRPKTSQKYSGQKSLATADNSSCAAHVPLTHGDSRIRSKSKEGPENKGKPTRSSISSLSKPKAASEEWLVLSIASKEDGQRKKDKEKKQWLRAGITSGADIVQESSRGGTMEMIFYDIRLKNFEDQ